ncbi:MAG TPA: HD domain-containing protein [Candidatus Acidoferrum sp.]|nr:HD domain-containing protein [Candidatus Acidoferrum sp.]
MIPGARLDLGVIDPGARIALEALAALLGPDRPAFLVGGALRDLLEGGAAADLDVVVPSGAVATARAMADRLGAALVVLDEARGAARLASGPGRRWRGPQIDVADYRAKDLEGDLRRRDFTVNAIAVGVHGLIASGEAAVEDPTGGVQDLSARTVRLCAPGSLEEDPVRVLRAARLAARPGWRLEPSLGAAARRAAGSLGAVSAERIRDELIAILTEHAAGVGLRLLDGWDVLERLLPERAAMQATAQPVPHRFDVWEHSLRAVEAADALGARPGDLGDWGSALRDHLAESLGDGLTRREAIKLAALLHDVAKPETRTVDSGRIRFFGHDVIGAGRVEAIAARWRLSGRARALLERLVRHHLRPMHLAQTGGVTRRARYRFFRDLGQDAPDLLLLALADAAAVRGESPWAVWRGAGGAILRELLAGHAEESAAAAAPPLLSGDDVMAALGLRPGPEVGRLLALVREAQDLGAVVDREQALDLLRREAGRS